MFLKKKLQMPEAGCSPEVGQRIKHTAELKGDRSDKGDWKEQWDCLSTRTREKSKALPPLSDEEIMAEVRAVREARRAEGSC